MGKTKEQSCYNCYSCLQQGKITTCPFTNKVGSECKILSSLIFFRYLATKAPFPEVTHLCWSAYRRRSALPWWNSHYSVLWIEHPPGVGGRLRAEAAEGGLHSISWHILGTNMSYGWELLASTMLQGKQPLVWKRKSSSWNSAAQLNFQDKHLSDPRNCMESVLRCGSLNLSEQHNESKS